MVQIGSLLQAKSTGQYYIVVSTSKEGRFGIVLLFQDFQYFVWFFEEEILRDFDILCDDTFEPFNLFS